MKSSIYLLNWTVPLIEEHPVYPEDLCEQHLQPSIIETLTKLSEQDLLYVVAGSTDLNESSLERIFERLGLSRFIQGYFCASNVQLQKGTPAFLLRTMMMLNTAPGKVIVVGEDYQLDIQPALLLGLRAIWLSKSDQTSPNPKVRKLAQLTDIFEPQSNEVIAQ